MKVKYIFIAFLSLFVSSVVCDAQSLGNVDASKKMKSDSLVVFDHPKYLVYYEYEFNNVPEDDFLRQKTITLLQIGEKYSDFRDLYKYKYDSISCFAAKEGKSFLETFPLLTAMGKNKKMNIDILFNNTSKEMTCSKNIFAKNYMYKEPLCKIDWSLSEGDSIIEGYSCKKATARFRGRDYIAWYSPDVPLSYGPYKFGGLPGLILSIYDTKKHHVFNIVGLQQVDGSSLNIYISEQILKLPVMTREDVNKIDKNAHANPAKALEATLAKLNAKYDKNMLKDVKSRPFNPIELE